MKKIDGNTKIIGFFGSTYKTSKMYAIYNQAFQALKLNFVYVPFVVDDLQKAVYGIRNLGIHAVGVTVPFKTDIIKFLDGLDDDARRIGAVNLVKNEAGRLIGGNTDGKGAILALKEKTEISGKRVILLGAGGAGRPIAFAVSDNCGKLTIVNRTKKTAKKLAATVGGNFAYLNDLEPLIKEADILIQATTVGMTPDENKSLIDKKMLHPRLIVQEIVNKPIETKLIKDAKAAGCQVVSGDRMLLWQAVEKFEIYTGKKAPIEVMEAALKRSLKQ